MREKISDFLFNFKDCDLTAANRKKEPIFKFKEKVLGTERILLFEILKENIMEEDEKKLDGVFQEIKALAIEKGFPLIDIREITKRVEELFRDYGIKDLNDAKVLYRQYFTLQLTDQRTGKPHSLKIFLKKG